MEELPADMWMSRLLPAALKAKLRPRKRRLQSAYINRFHSFTPHDLLAAIVDLGIQQGDVVMVHSSFDQFRGFHGGMDEAVEVLQKAVGEDGALLMPTFPFSGFAVDYANRGRITDVAKTLSRTGVLTEVFRRSPGVTRSIHPTHPVAGWGQKACPLLENHHLAKTPCGDPSPFYKLLEADGKILLVGVGIRCMTFFHSVEDILRPAMAFSPLTREEYDLRTIGTDGNTYTTNTRLFDPAVSARRDCELMVPTLKKRGVWRETHVGKLRLTVLRARDVKDTLVEMASHGNFCYR